MDLPGPHIPNKTRTYPEAKNYTARTFFSKYGIASSKALWNTKLFHHSEIRIRFLAIFA